MVQAVDFESDDPPFAGTMTITWSLAPAPLGTQASLENLSDHLWNQ